MTVVKLCEKNSNLGHLPMDKMSWLNPSRPPTCRILQGWDEHGTWQAMIFLRRYLAFTFKLDEIGWNDETDEDKYRWYRYIQIYTDLPLWACQSTRKIYVSQFRSWMVMMLIFPSLGIETIKTKRWNRQTILGLWIRCSNGHGNWPLSKGRATICS